MRKSINKIFHWYYNQRYKHIEHFMKSPHEVQESVFKHLIETSRHTEWGRKYNYKEIKNQELFASRIPVQDYESLKPYITKMMYGEKDVLWAGQVKWFSKSSGTTSDKSKFIPVSAQNLKKCHIKGTWDTMTLMYHNYPDARAFELKTLLMGGSINPFAPFPQTKIGDVSAIMIEHMPSVAKPFCTPDFETALMQNFEEKIERLAQILSVEKDMWMIGGVPTWTVVLFRRILEITGKKHMLEVWPQLEAYVHGGVSFTPYKEQFQQFLPSDKFIYQEIYNASEGYFAIQNDFKDDDMLLLLDNGIYYEFLPMDEWHNTNPKAIPLSEVELGLNYALVISTNSGLWRYTPGDTVMFTSKYPYKIKITGRTQQFVNAFGEEVMVSNTDKAIALTCLELDAIVSDYTVAPVYFSGGGKGSHEWLIEFEKRPDDINLFVKHLDQNLQSINSDYEAKRYKAMALECLKLRILPKGTFHHWLKSKGKYGGQSKVPRLSNNRKFVDEIMNFAGDGDLVFGDD